MANIATITNNVISALSGTTSQVLLGDATLTDFKLDSLTDVNVPTPGDGDVLRWNATTSLWEASDAAGITGSGTTNYIPRFTPNGGTLGNSTLRTDAAGNIGINVDPSAWSGVGRSLELQSSSFITAQGQYLYIGANFYYDGTNAIRKSLGPATQYAQQLGQHQWFTAPTGEANDVLTMTQAMTLNASGNLAIGTTSAGERLHIVGRQRIVTSDIYALNFWKDATPTVAASVGIVGTGFSFNIYNGTSWLNNIIHYTSAGNVGIGTTSPTALLHISATASADIIALSYPTLGKVAGIYLDSAAAFYGAGATNTTNAFLAHHTSNVLSFRTGATERMRIDASGYVGIGTSTPKRQLDVSTTGSPEIVLGALSGATDQKYWRVYTANDIMRLGYVNDAFSSAADVLNINRSGNVGIGTTTIAASPNYRSLNMSGTNGSEIYMYAGTTLYGYIYSDANGLAVSAQSSTPIYFRTGSSEKMRLDVAGNLGIGTTAPASKLHVIGDGRFGSYMYLGSEGAGGVIGDLSTANYLRFLVSNLEAMRIISSGNIGIGNTSPQAQLQVGAKLGTGLNVYSFTGYKFGVENGTSRFIGPEITGSNQSTVIADFVLGASAAWPNPTGLLTFTGRDRGNNVDSGVLGYVGITKTSAANDIGSGNLIFGTAAAASLISTERMRITATGDVGIGTSSPAYKLDVNGTMRVTGASALNAGATIPTGFFLNFGASGIADSSGALLIRTQANPMTFSGHDGGARNFYFNGYVGVNTNTPAYRLDVNGDARINNNLYMYASAGIGTYVSFKNDTNTAGFDIGHLNGANGDAYIYQRSNHPLIIATNNTERMRITSAGLVGIGTSAPSAGVRLQVEGNIFSNNVGGNSFSINSAGANYGFILNNSANTFSLGYGPSLGTVGTSVLTWNSSGNVGIGTTAPSYKFQVETTNATAYDSTDTLAATPVAWLYNNSTTASVAATLRLDGGQSGGNGAVTISGVHVANGSSAITFGTRNLNSNVTERVRIDNAGNLGIGTTAPTSPLSFGKSVYGAPDSENFYRIKFQDNGGIHNDVGIGQPVAGCLGFNTGAAGYTSFSEGTNGERMRIAAGGNVGIGTTTPAAKFSVQLSGSANQRLANFRNTGGNSFIEIQSSGAGAVALWAAADNQFGIYQNATAGTMGTAVFYANASGNVGIGTTSPTQKLDVNGDALINGVRVGRGPNNLAGNTVFGVSALNGITTGTNNVAIGQNALDGTTTGNFNIAIGYLAGGIGAAENSTGSGNIFIGTECQGESSTQSNRTWIGAPTTTSTWLAGNLLLGTKTNSTYRLDVVGTGRITNGLYVSGGIVAIQTLAGSGTAIVVADNAGNLSTQPTSTYLSSLSGEATNSGSVVTLTNSAVIGKVLTGLNVTSAAITASDNILSAFGKIQGQIDGLQGGTIYKGSWNASTNTPTITSGTGTQGNYYVVTTAGTTTIDGVSSWAVGDWIIFNGTVWEKIPNVDAITSVNGQTGVVSLTTSNINEGTNLYYTDARSRAAISLTVSGASGSATYNNSTGVLNIPTYTLAGLGGASAATTITINGTAQDLSTNRTFNVGTVTSIVAGSYLTGGTITTSGTIAVDATTTNTGNKIVARDASGNFAAGTITANLTGTASLASQVSINYNNNSDASYQMLWGSGNSVYGTAGITCNPFTDSMVLTGTLFSGGLTVTGFGRMYGGDFWHSGTANNGSRTPTIKLGRFSDSELAAYTIYTDDTNGDILEFLSERYTGDFRLTRNSDTGIRNIMRVNSDDGGTSLDLYTGGGSTLGVKLQSNGDARFAFDVVAYYSFSDARLKTNVATIENPLQKVMAMRGVTYEWNEGYKAGKKEIGLIAQEVMEIIPEVVAEKERVDGSKFLSVDYEHLTGLLIEAVKELKKEVDELKSK